MALQGAAALQVVAPDGTEFMAEWGPFEPPVTATFWGRRDPLGVAKRSSRQFWFPLKVTAHLTGAEFFCDRRLRRPGEYRLRLVLNPRSQSPVVSSEARLTVASPKGIDADVWAAVRPIVEAAPAVAVLCSPVTRVPPQLASDVLRNHPESRYYVALALQQPIHTDSEELEGLDRALAAANDDIVRDLILLVKAGRYLSMMSRSLADGNLPAAAESSEAARKILRELTESPFSYIADEATEMLGRARNAQQLRDSFDEIHKTDLPAPEAVTPTIDCVDVIDGLLSVRFGFVNPNAAGKRLMEGRGNRVLPSSAATDLPKYFRPGTHAGAFSATTQGPSITWELDGKSVTADASFPTRCTPADSGSLPRPIVECARQTNHGVEVTLGYENRNAFAVTVPVGERNRFAPGAEDRGQPRIFLAGRQKAVFKVKVAGEELTWTLGQSTVTLTPRTQTPCQ